MNADERRYNELSERIIGCAMTVSNELGCGFLEKVYQNALVVELRRAGLKVEAEKEIEVFYRGEVVGDYFADVLVEDAVLVELKAVKAFDVVHSAQCINYLRATNIKLCLLLNFGKPKLEIKRIVRNF